MNTCVRSLRRVSCTNRLSLRKPTDESTRIIDEITPDHDAAWSRKAMGSHWRSKGYDGQDREEYSEGDGP